MPVLHQMNAHLHQTPGISWDRGITKVDGSAETNTAPLTVNACGSESCGVISELLWRLMPVMARLLLSSY